MITKDKLVKIIEKRLSCKWAETIADEILALNNNEPNVQKVEPKYKSGDKVICKKSLTIGSFRHAIIIKKDSIHNLICANNTEGGTLGIFGIMSCIDPRFEEHFELYNEQEVKSNYEILEFTSKNSGCIAFKNNKGTYDSDNFSNLKELELLSDSKSLITKVKRLSDGEIFTIGDKVRTSSYFSKGNIISFTINKDNKLLVDYKLDESIGFLNCVCDHLKNLIKVKTSILVTEDDVEIYEGMEVFVVHPTTLNTIIGLSTIEYFSYKGWLFFSTKEAAEEYILLNKPCLSYNDIIKLANHHSNFYTLEQLKKLVKSKLK